MGYDLNFKTFVTLAKHIYATKLWQILLDPKLNKMKIVFLHLQF